MLQKVALLQAVKNLADAVTRRTAPGGDVLRAAGTVLERADHLGGQDGQIPIDDELCHGVHSEAGRDCPG